MKSRMYLVVVALILTSILVGACGGAAPTATPTTAAKPTPPEYIEIGSAIPLTGKYGSLGAMVEPGYEIAVADINAAGGIYVEEYGVKIPVRLTMYDDESDPTKTVSKMETLFSENHVVAYLGGAGGDLHAAAAPIAEKNKVPYLGIAFALYSIHQQGYKYLFSPFPKSPAQARDVFEVLDTIPEAERPSKVAIFQEKTDWGIELWGLWQEYADQYGYDIVVHEEYAPRSEDFSAMILKAKDAGAEVLLSVPSPPDGLAIQKQMAELGWTPKFELMIRAPENVSWTETLGSIGDYATMFAGWNHGEKFPGVAELNAVYEAEFGRPADLLTGPAYACVQILADAIERAGTLDRDAIRDAIAATDMMTVIGPVTFNADGTGNVLNPMSQWQNGVMQLVWPADQATAPLAYPAIPFEDRGGAVAAATPTTAPKPPAPEYIEIGSSIPLTGKYGSLGAMVEPGYQIAVADINAAGGVYVEEYGVKIPIRLTIYDDESDPTKTVSKMEALFSEDNVVAYLGGAGSDMHAAAAPIAEKNKVPYLGIAFALYSIHQQGYKYLFSPFPKSPDQARDVFEVLDTIPEAERPSKVAVFQEKTDWGIELWGLWQEYADQYGYEIVVHEEYAPRSEDFSAMILKAKDAGAEVLLSVPSPPDGLAMQKQMAELGWTPKFELMIRAPENVSWTETLGSIGDYATIFAGWHHGEKFPGVAELNAVYEAEFGRPADLLTGPAYACVQILADAIERAGTLDRDAIRDAIAATDMMTVIGPVTFNADGTGNVLNPMAQWQDGELQLVWPIDQATAPLAYPAVPFEDR